MIGYYHKFIRKFAVSAKPLCDLTKNDVPFQWLEIFDRAFNKLKQKMLSPDVFGFLYVKQTFILTIISGNKWRANTNGFCRQKPNQRRK